MDDQVFGLIFPLLFMLVIFGFIMHKKFSKEAKKLGAKLNYVGVHLYGLPGLNGKEFIKLFFTDKNIIVKTDKKTYELDYKKITAVASGNKSDLLKKDRSVIGRGIAGGILLGPVAAIIGGMSAIGKQKHIKGDFLIMNYVTGENEERTLIFDLKNMSHAKKAEKFIQDKNPELVEPDYITL